MAEFLFLGCASFNRRKEWHPNWLQNAFLYIGNLN